MKIIKITIAALLILAVAALSGVGRPQAAGGASDDPRQGITVTGTGHAKAVPDEAEFSLGIMTKGQTARAALTANSAQMRELIAALKAAGLSARDIKTENVSVGASSDGTSTPEGFTARNSVSVHIRDLTRAGAVLDAASHAGANEVYGPTVSRSDREQFEAKALKECPYPRRRSRRGRRRLAGRGDGDRGGQPGVPRPGPGHGRTNSAGRKDPDRARIRRHHRRRDGDIRDRMRASQAAGRWACCSPTRPLT
jgi:hypothetical protein